MSGTSSATPSGPFGELAAKTGRRWVHLAAAAERAQSCRQAIRQELAKEKLVPPDCSLVVFGSLARDEYTARSDVDWTLLVDGAADPQHLAAMQRIASLLERLGCKKPGQTGAFGGLAFSHQLVHLIGGEDDTNRNTTQRILLLLESHEIHGSVRERVLRNILRRYLEEDDGHQPPDASHARVPRFLLNDVVRFWRIMAVDFAAKRRQRAASGWAIRHLKLRLSRKLVFAAGLATCLSCLLCRPATSSSSTDSITSATDDRAALTDFLLEMSNCTPLEVVIRFGLHFGAEATCTSILDLYEQFTAILQDATQRNRLETMKLEDAVDDPLFREGRRIARGFQEALDELFFGTDPTLTRATQRYGVF